MIALQVFGMDMIFNFFLPYQNKDMIWVQDQSRIIPHYVSTWFLIDAVSVIPFDLLASSASSRCVPATMYTILPGC